MGRDISVLLSVLKKSQDFKWCVCEGVRVVKEMCVCEGRECVYEWLSTSVSVSVRV